MSDDKGETPQGGEPGTVAVTIADEKVAATYKPTLSAETPKLRLKSKPISGLNS